MAARVSSLRRCALIVVDMQNRFGPTTAGSCQKNVCPPPTLVEVTHTLCDQHHDPDPTSVLFKWWNAPIYKNAKDWEMIHCVQKALTETLESEDKTKERGEVIGVPEKTTYSAFEGTLLLKHLRERDVDTVVICGTMTNLCSETTARCAFTKNFNVIFLSDGNATCSAAMHEATLENLKFGFADVISTQEWIGRGKR